MKNLTLILLLAILFFLMGCAADPDWRQQSPSTPDWQGPPYPPGFYTR